MFYQNNIKLNSGLPNVFQNNIKFNLGQPNVLSEQH
jgi:hypothetical protein